jgi:hypothetical protein
MSDTVSLDGKEYISSKRASELSGYTQDYIGQLARGGNIDARRVSGLWYVRMDSLNAYKSAAETYKPQPPGRVQDTDPESLISFDGKDYVSASRAAKLTGYHQDYVGQLARSGTVLSRQVGNRWYVERTAILAHKREKDRLLAAVQAQAVGIAPKAENKPETKEVVKVEEEPFFTYMHEENDLLPRTLGYVRPTLTSVNNHAVEAESGVHSTPLRILPKTEILDHKRPVKRVKSSRTTHRNTIFYGSIGGAAVALAVVAIVVFSKIGINSSEMSRLGPSALAANAGEIGSLVGSTIEKMLVPELTYFRSN